MSTRPSRSASIPIPSNSSAAARNNIENVISMPFVNAPGSLSASRPRLATTTRFPAHGSSTRGIAPSGAHPSLGNQSIGSFSGSYSAVAASSPPAFEPRIIRATTSPPRSSDPGCVPVSTSPTVSRTRRTSGSVTRPTSTTTLSGGSRATFTPSSVPSAPLSINHGHAHTFPRPAYLEQSALRHLLHTDIPSTHAATRYAEHTPGRFHMSGTGHHHPASPASTPMPYPYFRRDLTPALDSDDDSTASPPPPTRGVTSPAPNALLVNPVLRLPTRWSEQDRNPSLSVLGDGRELTFHGPSCGGEREAAAARANHPIPPACGIYYYEVEILHKGSKGHISIGFASGDVRLSRLPGWEKHSWGYHADDGWSFPGHKDGSSYGPTFDTGDIIGCGVDFSQNRAFYTKNGIFLGMVFENVGKEPDLYPSVGMRHNSESIRVNFGHAPFKYAIEDHVHNQRNVVWAGIQRTKIDWPMLQGGAEHLHDESATAEEPDQSREQEKEKTQGGYQKGGAMEEEEMKAPLRKLVLSYLAHHGYASTARAFQAQLQGANVGGTSGEDGHDETGNDGDEDDVMNDERPAPSTPWMDSEYELDLRTRINIVNAVLKGDIDTALTETRVHHPSVLEREQGLIEFKLRCRKFVELILETSEALKKITPEDKERTRKREKEKETERETEMEEHEVGNGLDESGAMDVDDPSPEAHPTTSTSDAFLSAAAAQDPRGRSPSSRSRDASRSPGPSSSQPSRSSAAEIALRSALEYGRALETDYKHDARPEVRSHLKRTFGVVAYQHPLAAGGEVAEMAGQEARARLANELNQAILESQGKPAHPALETLYRQTAACVVQLGLMGVGSAAFADMSKEFLEG